MALQTSTLYNNLAHNKLSGYHHQFDILLVQTLRFVLLDNFKTKKEVKLTDRQAVGQLEFVSMQR